MALGVVRTSLLNESLRLDSASALYGNLNVEALRAEARLLAIELRLLLGGKSLGCHLAVSCNSFDDVFSSHTKAIVSLQTSL